MKEARGPGRGGPSRAFERPTAGSGVIIRRLWRYLERYKWMLVAALILGVGGNLLALLGPKLSGYAIDAIRPGAGRVEFDTVFFYAKWMLLCYLVSAVFSYLLAALLVRLSRNVVSQLRRDLYQHLMKLPIRFFDTRATGDVLSVLSYDVDTVSASLSNDLAQMVTSVVTVVGSFFMMLTISPHLLLVFAVTIPASILFTRYRSARVRPLYRKRSEQLGALNGFAEEMTDGLRTIKAYGREEAFWQRFEEKNKAACDANCKADAFASSTGPTVNFINNLSLALVSVFGSLLYMAGGITLGNVSSFVLYSRKFSGPINEFANIISELQSSLAAAERIFALLDEPTEAPDAPDAEELRDVVGAVEIQGVKFGYDPGHPVLRDLHLSAKPGQVVAIVGPTGAGKTTVINLLMRFYDPDFGSIRVDGKEIKTLTRASLRRAYSMVLQDTWLFTGTVFENLSYGREGVTLEQVQQAARAAKIDRFIQSLPQGYDTVLQDGGANISKGQRQLLTIARAMLLDAPMLILDEATSNVDTRTERRIQAAMLRL
ncbi:MAG TPA: ABC transporter ATP-binding protein/permease, partial [Candidatus Pygmaiobacter gallistercoris]|nr:ABC transporter ATP-binding protein/permease [Candidatus Pygmaiobacter gallistercoris]